jgi:hypothetical protein
MDEAQRMHDVLATLDSSADVLNYKQFKKLLKVSLAHMDDPVHTLPKKVQDELTDAFWQQMLMSTVDLVDEAPSASAWFLEVLKHSIHQEAERVNSVIQELHFRNVTTKKNSLQNLNMASHAQPFLLTICSDWNNCGVKL